MTNTMLDVVTHARIDTGTGIVRATPTNVMMDAGIDVVTKGMTDVEIDM